MPKGIGGKAVTSFEMATNGVTVQLVPHDEEEVKLYFADNIADHPVYKDNIADQQLVYKGIITLHLIGPPNFAELWSQDQYLRDLHKLTEAAKERAKILDANAVVGMKITVDTETGRYRIEGVAVRYSK